MGVAMITPFYVRVLRTRGSIRTIQAGVAMMTSFLVRTVAVAIGLVGSASGFRVRLRLRARVRARAKDCEIVASV